MGPLVPAIAYGWMWCASSYVERCAVKNPARVWDDPAKQRQYTSLVRRLTSWDRQLPSADGSVWFAEQLKRWTWRFPRPSFWIAIGLIGLIGRRPRGTRVGLALVALAGLVLAVHAASGVLDTGYGVPVYPAFFLAAAAGLAGTRPAGSGGEVGGLRRRLGKPGRRR
jgi:hypothetical protein